MTAGAFAAFLDSPESDAFPSKLYELIVSSDFTGRDLSTVAGSYLQAFCDSGRSLFLRRWIGIALRGMMDASPKIAKCLKQSQPGLCGLGKVIIDDTEREEIRIVAGLLIRQAMENGIKFDSFWSSDKLRRSALKFPTHPGPEWLLEFQGFLDVLTDLKFMDCPIDLVIVYAVSASTSDGFKWSASCGGTPVIIIQESLLTFLAPDAQLRSIQFIDVPIEHIVGITLRKSALYNSQTETTNYDPYDLIIGLAPSPSTYCQNASSRAGTTIKLLLKSFEDAQQCQLGIEEIQKRKASQKMEPHPYMSSSGLIDAGSSPSPQNVNPKKVKLLKPLAISEVRQPSNIIPNTSIDVCSLSHEEKSFSHSTISTNVGKLSKVSKAAKAKALRPVHPRNDQGVPPRVQATSETTTRNPGNTQPADGLDQRQSKETQIRSKALTKTQRSQNKRKTHDDDDNEFLPDSVARKKPATCKDSAKKVAVNKGRPIKRLRRKVDDATQSKNSHGEKVREPQTAKPRVDVTLRPQRNNHGEDFSSRISKPISLIGGLKAFCSRSPTDIQPFKKPDLPQKSSHLPSTPCKVAPRARAQQQQIDVEDLVETQAEDSSISSSPPDTSFIIEENEVTVQNTSITEIPSSNSKPVPASPNAESTAISGHAIRDDVDTEQKLGEMQTFQRDPFQKRDGGRRMTMFTRRLTGEMEVAQHSSPSVAFSIPVQGSDANTSKALTSLIEIKTFTRDGSHHSKRNTGLAGDVNETEVTTRAQTLADPDTSIKKASHNHRIFILTDNEPVAKNSKREISDQMIKEPLSDSDLSTTVKSSTAPLRTELAPVIRRTVAQIEKEATHWQPIPTTPPQGNTHSNQEATLVQSDTQSHRKAPIEYTSLLIRSTSPFPSSPSSHSSTSAAKDSSLASPISTSSEEMAWEVSLQPHQRDLRDMLLRISDRVLLHIVDNEMAVDEIAQEYARDGAHVLDLLRERCEKEYGMIIEGMRKKQAHLKAQLKRTLSDLRGARERVSGLV